MRSVAEKSRAKAERRAAITSSTHNNSRTCSSVSDCNLRIALSLSGSRQDAPYFLRRNFQTLRYPLNLLVFLLPNAWDDDLRKIFRQLLEGLVAGDALRPCSEFGINAAPGHDLVAQRLDFFPELVRIAALEKRRIARRQSPPDVGPCQQPLILRVLGRLHGFASVVAGRLRVFPGA